MNTHLRSHIASFFLLLPAAAGLMAWPASARAQPAGPEIRSLEIAADGGFEAGSQLTFTLAGTPRAEGEVRVRGLRDVIALRETARGVYVGNYTIKRGDRATPDAEVQATLRLGNRSASAGYVLTEAMAARRPVVMPPLRIERFGMAQFERLEPGVELRFALEGAPGGTVMVDLPGVASDVVLREVRAGRYEGGYTIRRADRFNLNQPLVATLRVGDRIVTSGIALQPAAVQADNRPPDLVNLMPRDGETVPAGPPVLVGASFDDHGGTGVDPASVQILLSGRNITREAQVNRQSFSFRGALPPGRHSVDVTARDQAGNVLRRSWSFAVAEAAPVHSLAAEIVSHQANALIGTDPVRIAGRTVPGASVFVTVHATPPAGMVIRELPPILFRETLQADGNGAFAFVLVPQLPYPGVRYDIVMVSSRGNVREESRTTLFQRE